MVNYILDFNGSTYEFRYDESDRSKYTVFACAKNENDYIAEWVDYHLSIGFDKIFICDNNDIGDDSLYKVLESYVKEGTVEIFDIRGFEAFQCQVYDMYSSVGNYEWCAFIDIDEFIEIGSHYFDIKDYLSNVEEDCVLLNWMMYGYCDELYKTDKVLESFKTPIRHVGLFKENAWLKSIVRGSSKPRFYYNMHTAVFDEYGHNYLVSGSHVANENYRMSFPPIYKHIYLKHYYSRSIEDFFNKTKRNDAYIGKPGTNGFMSNGYNLSILSNTPIMPIEKFALGLYMYDDNSNGDGLKDIISNFDVICVINEDNNPYCFIHFVVRLMMSTENHTIILSGVIDNSVFNMLLDYSYETNNKIVWCPNDKDLLYKCYLKYTKNSDVDTYYVFNF